MELKNIDLKKKDFQKYFVFRHIRNWSLISLPLLLIMVVIAFIYRTIYIGFDFLNACYLITFFVAIIYIFTIFKLSKSYENKPYDLRMDKGIYEIRRKNENNRLVTTFKKDLKDFLFFDENKEYYFLFPKKNTTFIIPKNMLSGEDKKYFEAQINKKIEKRKTPWLSRIFNIILSISAILFSVFFLIGVF